MGDRIKEAERLFEQILYGGFEGDDVIVLTVKEEEMIKDWLEAAQDDTPGLEAPPRYWTSKGLDDLADWIKSEAGRLKLSPVEFAEEIEETLRVNYTDREAANVLRTWAYDYAIVVGEEADD